MKVTWEEQFKESVKKDPLENKYIADIDPIEDKKESKAGMRFNTGKLRWSLVHFKSLEPLVKVLEFGAKKYDDHNWKKGLNKKEILESTMRHLAALIDGEEFDSESGLPHIGHIQCNAMFYQYMIDNNIDIPPLNKKS